MCISLHLPSSVSVYYWSSMLLAFSFVSFCLFFFTFISLVSVQAQDFYVEMKWEFTSWGESTLCILRVKLSKANHLQVISLSSSGTEQCHYLFPVVLNKDALRLFFFIFFLYILFVDYIIEAYDLHNR